MEQQITALNTKIEELQKILFSHRHMQYDKTKELTHIAVPIVSGAPSGTPKIGTMAYDKTNNKLYLYNGAWKSVQFS